MVLQCLDGDFTVCKLANVSEARLDRKFCFFAHTDGEISLVCLTADAPTDTIERDDGWKAFRVRGKLEFSLVGILSRLSSVLAENGIPVFAVSTFDTDYLFVKSENSERAALAFSAVGCEIES